MERFSNIALTMLIAGLSTIGDRALVAQQNPVQYNNINTPQASPYQDLNTTATTPSQPRRLSINVAINSPNDLKVREGDFIQAGQIVADRVQERQSLEAQKAQISVSIKRLENAQVMQPLTPKPVPPVQSLPPAYFSTEEAQIKSAQLNLQQAQRMYEFALSNNPFINEQANIEKAQAEKEAAANKHENQSRKLDAIAQLPGLPPEVRVHESEKLKQTQLEKLRFSAEYNFKVAELDEAKQSRSEQLKNLQNAVEKAQADLNLAVARLQKARSNRAELEYNHSITAARRIEEQNQAQQFYSRQMSEYHQGLQDQEFKLTQLREKLNDVETKLSALSTVKSPYSGKIRRIKQERQENGLLYVELTLVPN